MINGKVVVVGDGACGKTCMLEVFRSNKFPEHYVPTVVDNFVKEVKFDKNKSATLAFWDTAGQEDYDTIRPLSYRETDLVLLCYTINNKRNLENVSTKWLAEIKNYCPNAGYILVGLKEDLRYSDEEDKDALISTAEGEEMAKQIGARGFFECSALTKKNIDLVFEAAAREVMNLRKQTEPQDTCGICCAWCPSIFRCC